MQAALRTVQSGLALCLAGILTPTFCQAGDITPYLFADFGRSESSPGFRGGWGGGLRHESGWGLQFQYSHGREVEYWMRSYQSNGAEWILLDSVREFDETRVKSYSVGRQFRWKEDRWALDLRVGRYELEFALPGMDGRFTGTALGLTLERRLSPQLSLGIDLQQLRLPRDDVLRPALRLSWSFPP